MQEQPDNATSRPVSASQAPEVLVRGSTVQDDWRAALAEALRPAEPWPGAPRPEEVADALLPTVRHLVAAELRAAGEDSTHWRMIHEAVYVHLNARADRLDATPDHGKA